MERHLLSVLADNDALFEAVKATVTEKFSSLIDHDFKRTDLDDKRLGELVRARLTGLRLVEEVFRDIALCKTNNQLSSNKNPAR